MQTPPPPPEPLYVLRGHRAAVQCVAFLPGNGVLAAGDGEGDLKLWDLDSRRISASIRAHESHSGILQVACPVSNNPYVISQGRNGVVKCWQIHSGSSFSSDPVQVLSAGSYNFCRFALLQQGQTSSSCSVSHAAVQVSNSSIAEPITTDVNLVQGFQVSGPVPSTATEQLEAVYQPQSPIAGASGQSRQQKGNIRGLLSEQLRQQQQPEDQPQEQQLQELNDRLAYFPTSLNTQQGFASATASELSSRGLAGGAELTEKAELDIVHRTTAPANAADATVTASNSTTSNSQSAQAGGADNFAAGGQCMLALPGSDAADVGVWQLGQHQGPAGSTAGQVMLLKQQRSQGRPSHGLCMAVVLLQPQGSALHALTGYEDGTVALWDTRQPSSYLTSSKLHSESVMCLAAAADCSSGFSGAADEHLTAFDLDIPGGNIKLNQQLDLPKAGVADVAIRPDGRIAASAGWDSKIRIWHARKRRPLALLRWHSQQVACVTFSSDNRLMAAGGRDNHISMWSIYPPER